MTNTLNEVMAYVDTYVKTQLAKYQITDDAFVTDINVAMFLMFAGKQKLYQPGVSDFILNQSQNKIPVYQLGLPQQKPEKKGLFSFFNKPKQVKQPSLSEPAPQPQNISKKKKKDEYNDVEKEIAELEKKIGKPEKTGFWHAVWEKWKEEAWESPEERERRLELQRKEIENKLKLEKEKLDLIAYKKKLRSKPEKSERNESSDNNSTDTGEED